MERVMTSFALSHDWQVPDLGEPICRQTTGPFLMSVNGVTLTQCEDIWSRTVRESVQVSAYPVALWFAANWWRICTEPLPHRGSFPSTDWRLSHELGSAATGYVWPQVLFASDGEAIYVWAASSNPNSKQSIKYLSGLDIPARISIQEFKSVVARYIDDVLARLAAVGLNNTELRELWKVVRTEAKDQLISLKRRREAVLGFDPEELPNSIEAEALQLEKRIGASSLEELAPAYGALALKEIIALRNCPGPVGRIELSIPDAAAGDTSLLPWQRAVSDAKALRDRTVNNGPVSTEQLCELLGIARTDYDSLVPTHRLKTAVAIPQGRNRRYVFRKKLESGRRFEAARFFADHIFSANSDSKWLASTDLWTSRQRYQKAFAAEYLCPIDDLRDFLDGDYGTSAIDDAANHFQVSPYTVTSLLANNGVVPRHWAESPVNDTMWMSQ